jgi:arylsulfatase A-like enzyme
MSARPIAAAVALLLFAAQAPSQERAPDRAADPRPNVVVIVADDLGGGDLSCYGAKDVATPRLDALASSGIRFTAGYATAPVCAPSRAGLLSGRYPQRFGFEFNQGQGASRAANFGLPADVPTLAERLRAAGYATGMVGKWHLGDQPGQRPTDRGFDDFFGFLDNASHDDPARRRDRFPILRGTETVNEKARLTTAFGRESAAFVERNAARPFFLYVAHAAVHAPLEPDPRVAPRVAAIADERRRDYANSVVGLDDAVGVLLDALHAKGLDEQTLVVFVSDNGSVRVPSNAPWRGGKTQLFDGGVRVPFMLRWTGRLPASVVEPRRVSTLDLAATALAAAGVARTPEMQLDGVDLLPFLANSAEPHATLFWRFGSRFAVRAGDWKLVAPIPDSTAMLFDCAADPGERNDLAAAQPEKVKELRALWDEWNAKNVAPLWQGKEDQE